MKITIPESEGGEVWRHFWEEPPPGSVEFWALRWPIKAKPGDGIEFYYRKQLVAYAVVLRVEPPGISECDRTGKYRNRWKVVWDPATFRDMR